MQRILPILSKQNTESTIFFLNEYTYTQEYIGYCITVR